MENILNNQKGFTLVEIMVAVGLVGGLALTGMTLFKNQDKAQKTVERNYEVTTVVNELRGILSNPANCTPTFSGRSPSTGTVTAIKKEINSVLTDVYLVNTALPGGIQIKSYKLSRSNTTLASNETILEITFARGKGTIKDTHMRQIKLLYTLSGANIATCYAAAGTVDSLWEISTSDSNDIFYNSGDVGIGIADPVGRLDVASSVAGKAGVIIRKNSALNSESNLNLRLLDSGATVAMHLGVDPTNGNFGFIQTMQPAVSWTNRPLVLQPIGGLVGIGTTAPIDHLHIEQAGYSSMRVVNSSYNSTVVNQVLGDGTARSTYVTPSRSWVVGVGTQASGSDSNFAIRDNNLAVARLVINSTGNVGIGTSSPNTNLEISSNVGNKLRLTDTNGNTWNHLEFYDNASRQWWMGQSNISNGFTIGNDIIGHGLFLEKATGNIGIGTTAPSNRLQVNGSLQAGQYVWRHNVNWTMTDSAGDYSFDFNSADGSSLWHVWDPVHQSILSVRNNGRVGINTSTPGSLFNVQQSSGSWTDGIRITKQGTTDYFDILNDGSGPNMLTLAANADYAKSITLYANNGNVGIGYGTTVPGYKLDVNGVVRATSFIYYSDRRLKEKISPIENPLGKILGLQGRKFRWKKNRQADVGFIAQEVQQVEPDLVSADADGFLSVKYGNLTALIVEGMKNLTFKLASILDTHREIEAKLKLLDAENRVLKQRLDRLEKKDVP